MLSDVNSKFKWNKKSWTKFQVQQIDSASETMNNSQFKELNFGEVFSEI